MTENERESETLACPHGSTCGGCAFLGVPYSEQLARKQALVARGLARYPHLAALKLAPVAGAQPTQAYRARAKLVFGKDGALGLFERQGHTVVDIPECRVLSPLLLRVVAAARRVFSHAIPALDGLDVRLVDDGALVTLIAPRGTALADLTTLAQALRAETNEVRSVAASFREAGAATVLGTGHVVLSGDEVAEHHLLEDGPYHLAAHGAFTQVHLGQANAAYGRIEHALKELGAKRVLELYAGSGALALRLAAAGLEVTAVEAFGPALAHVERAAREQKLALRAVNGQAERALRGLFGNGERFDALLVNPPRRGLSAEVRRRAASLEPGAILYMSCEPATLARDLSHLSELGYAAEQVWPFDMIPHSSAVESLVVLRRGPLPAPKLLYEHEHWLAVLKSGYEPVSPEAGFAHCLLERVRKLPGASLAVPLSAQQLDPDSSGVCLFARSEAMRPALEEAFGKGTQSFVVLCRGVTHKRGRVRRPVREAGRVVLASTRYLRESVRGGHSLLTVWPERASTPQLRQLFLGIGHAVLGDARFGDAASNTHFEHRHGLDRSFLHCSAVTLVSDTSHVICEAPLPGELQAVLESLSEQPAPKS
ncbi:MAG TPA: RsmD family RNA methyltransferase [Polyangiaceae bacterium]|nr:RsmD family RNA methyltransferase [Polyangiaceae bacterium]